MSSIWSAETKLPEFAPLSGCKTADVAVIGGGAAGILTAYLLGLQGASAVVLEADRILSGATKNTTAKITAQHGLIYSRMIRKFGLDFAQGYAQANRDAIAKYAELVRQNQIGCDFQECAAFCYDRENPEEIERETRDAERLGFSASFTKQTELPFPVAGAVRFGGQARFQPLAFFGALARGLTVFEHTRARSIENGCVMTDRGRVDAPHIVVATHFPFLDRPGYYFVRMYQQRSYVLALENAAELSDVYLDAKDGGLSFRGFRNLLLLGGGGHRCGKFREGCGYAPLRLAAREYYPQSRELFHWSAQDCMTADGVPYAGRYSSALPGVYIATGFQKWGMTGSMAAAMLLSDELCGKASPYAQVFSPQRFFPAACAAGFASNGAHTVAGIAKRVFYLPAGGTEKIGKGRAGVVQNQGEKTGIYRDEQGNAFAVTTKCPHLGCELSWNPDEKSWDCPCHGSRFDFRGNLIDNPAGKGISRKTPEAAEEDAENQSF